MGLFDKEIGPKHPLYDSGSLVKGTGQTPLSSQPELPPPASPEEKQVSLSIENQQLLDEELSEASGVAIIENLLAKGANPLGINGEYAGQPDYWPIAEKQDEEAWALFWATFSALSSRSDAPPPSQLVWLTPPCPFILGDYIDYGEELLYLSDGVNWEGGARLTMFEEEGLHVYYESSFDVTGILNLPSSGRVIAWAREVDSRRGYDIDSQAAKWSVESGLVASAIRRLSENYEDVEHIKGGTYSELISFD